MHMGKDHRADILWSEPQQPQLIFQGLLGRLIIGGQLLNGLRPVFLHALGVALQVVQDFPIVRHIDEDGVNGHVQHPVGIVGAAAGGVKGARYQILVALHFPQVQDGKPDAPCFRIHLATPAFTCSVQASTSSWQMAGDGAQKEQSGRKISCVTQNTFSSNRINPSQRKEKFHFVGRG